MDSEAYTGGEKLAIPRPLPALNSQGKIGFVLQNSVPRSADLLACGTYFVIQFPPVEWSLFPASSPVGLRELTDRSVSAASGAIFISKELDTI